MAEYQAFDVEKYADKKSILAVSGYLSESNTLPNDFQMPQLIYLICLAFYTNDNWDDRIKGEYLKIQGKRLTHTGTSNCYQTGYLRNVCAYPGIYRWKFKIRSRGKNVDHNNVWNLIFGVVKEKDSINNYITSDAFDTGGEGGIQCGDVAIGFISVVGCVTRGSGNYGKRYGIKCDTKDIVEMILDFNKLELRYCINGIEYGKAHSIDKDGRYRAVVTLAEKNGCIELL